MVRGIVYGYYQPASEKWYVGKTINEKARKAEHKKGSRSGSAFKRAVAKHGFDTFEYTILSEIFNDNIDVLNKELSKIEIAMIAEKDSFNNGYNCTIGGEGCVGYKHTAEHKAYISKIQKGHKMPTEQIETLRQINLGNTHWLGKSHNEETKKKISESKIGKKMDYNDEDRIKMGNRMSAKMSKVVLQFSLDNEFINEHSSVTKASENIGCSRDGISDCCNNKRTEYKGFIWKFK